MSRWPREKKRRWWAQLMRRLRAGWYWRQCRICKEGYNIDREMGVRPLRAGIGEIVCWWCAWEGRDGALPFMVSRISDELWGLPNEYRREPLNSQVKDLVAKHEAWRATHTDYIQENS